MDYQKQNNIAVKSWLPVLHNFATRMGGPWLVCTFFKDKYDLYLVSNFFVTEQVGVGKLSWIWEPRLWKWVLQHGNLCSIFKGDKTKMESTKIELF